MTARILARERGALLPEVLSQFPKGGLSREPRGTVLSLLPCALRGSSAAAAS